ncbi:MAG: ribonuclease HI [Bdellovibrio sp.]|nr:MAG: ribonuclease HI [Bdellovibrio sp.]
MLTREILQNSLIVFSDGACSGNPGPGGWGSIVALPDGRIKELGGRGDNVTNNQMEITGALKALQWLRDDPRPVYVFTDSVYLIRGITQWIYGWMKRGWVNAEGEAVANKDLWRELKRTVDPRGAKNVHWKFVRGHNQVPGNERCDEIAVAMTRGKWVNLYDGPLVGYSVAIFDLPEEEPLPEMKPKQEKAPAHSYLSYVAGVVRRHPSWASCERATKGRSGAKFKKAMSAADEKSILQAWNLSPQTPIKEAE